MTERKATAFDGTIFARKGEASPTHPIAALMLATTTPAAVATWPQSGTAPTRLSPAAGESGPAVPRSRAGWSSLDLAPLIRRDTFPRPVFATPRAKSNPAALWLAETMGAETVACGQRASAGTGPRRRRQLTVRLELDDFRPFYDLAERTGRTYQDILATATRALLERVSHHD